MRYTIVKYAQKDIWPHYFEDNPMEGVVISHSASFTHSGKAVDLDLEYESLEEAKKACERVNERNPCGYYEVCPVIDE